MTNVEQVTIAPARWTGRDDKFYLIVKYNDGSVRHDCRAFGFLSCAARARQMMLPSLRVVGEKVA